MEKTEKKKVPTLPFDTLFFFGRYNYWTPKKMKVVKVQEGWKMIRPSFLGGQHRPIFQRPWKLLVSGEFVKVH